MRLFSFSCSIYKPPPVSAAWVDDMQFLNFSIVERVATIKHQSRGINYKTKADVL